MALKAVFSAMKREGYIVKDLDLYLLGLSATDEDRAIDVNAPSQAGVCMRARYYARTGAPRDGASIDARTRRIFDNGTKTHERLQEYLLKQGMLLMDEVPVHNYEYNIQGHTDGVLKLSASERGILEIKSINSNGFSSLKGAKEDHRKQGLVYIFFFSFFDSFFKIFDILYSDNKQIVITSDRPAKELNIMERLTSRFQVGLTVDVQVPSHEHRIDIVKKNLNSNLTIQGVILSMFDGRTNLSAQVVQEVKRYFGGKVYSTVIPRNVRLAEAPSYGLPITLYDPKSRGAEAYMEFSEEFIELEEE